MDAITDQAVGFDLDSELELCRRLARAGGTILVGDVFTSARARRLFQGLLSTGRVHELEPHWQQLVRNGVDAGTLAPPEWN